jgi:hypothetical protein
MSDPVVDFYSGAAGDHRGRSREEIVRWSDDRLEAVHDFIQWLFPLPEASPVNPHAPLLTRETIRAFHTGPELRAGLRASLERMLAFYGFELRDDPLEVMPAENFQVRSRTWLHPGNHNHLRITRILRCCFLAGLDAEARAFAETLHALFIVEETKQRPGITAETLGYWLKAVG